jgi:hypothetical protein
VHTGHFLGDNFRDAVFMGGIDEGEQQGDGHRFDMLFFQLADSIRDGILVKGFVDRAVVRGCARGR